MASHLPSEDSDMQRGAEIVQESTPLGVVPHPAPCVCKACSTVIASELNNLAWDLLERTDRTPEDDERLVHTAHASCYHWLQAGTPLNHQRALCLLTTVYARLGYVDSALRYAARSRELSAQNSETQTPFDAATTHGAAALAYHCAGRAEEAQQARDHATQIAATFTAPDDREVFQRLYL